MLTAFKTLMGILCHCILSPALLASAISQHSVCLSVSKPLRADQSPFAASAPGCFPSSFHQPFLPHSISHPTFQLLFFIPLSSFFSLSTSSSSSLLCSSFSFSSLPVSSIPQFPRAVIALIHPRLALLQAETTSSHLPTLLLLTDKRGGGEDVS